jgi:hypothetical protein
MIASPPILFLGCGYPIPKRSLLAQADAHPPEVLGFSANAPTTSAISPRSLCTGADDKTIDRSLKRLLRYRGAVVTYRA